MLFKIYFDLRYLAMDRTNDEDEKRIRRRKLIGHDGMDINVASEEDHTEFLRTNKIAPRYQFHLNLLIYITKLFLKHFPFLFLSHLI